MGKNSVLRFGTLSITAAAFTLVGILIASQLDFSPRSLAVPQETQAIFAGSSASTSLAADGYSSPFVPVIEASADAVVAVSAERESGGGSGFFNSGRHPSSKSSGTGFFFRPDGYVLTNNHVVEDGEEIEVRTSSGFVYEARLVGLDPATDLAVLKVDTDDEITFIPFGDSDSVQVGQWAIAIGNPFPQQGLFGSVTVGIVSATGRSSLRFGGGSPDYQDYIQVDAAINPGNSGGPLLNLRGEAFGVNSAISSPTGSSVGIGFAVPINLARAIIPDLIAYGEVRRGWLGVQMANVTNSDARRLDLDEVRGVVVEEVVPGSPAEGAGLRQDDIIYEFGEHEVTNRSQFSILVSTTRQGVRVPLKVIRDKERLTLHAEIADKKAGNLAASQWLEGQGAPETYSWMGMELITFTRSAADRSGLEYHPGVFVVRVRNRSVARKVGFSPGDVITEISSKRVRNLEEFRRVTDAISTKTKTISMIVVDKFGNTEYRTVRPR
ncbi:MAG: trypsin-like peptidase domain-containing protein [Candidatus Zixiibacteriota bacterium]